MQTARNNTSSTIPSDSFVNSPALLWGCAICVVLSCAISFWNCMQHFKHYTRPSIQRHLVRIIIIVPIYVIGSFFSLCYPEHFLYFDTIRDLYEAFVIHNFMALMLGYMGGDSDCIAKLMHSPGEIAHPWPLCFLPKIPTDQRFLRLCKQGTLQFQICKPLCALISLIMLGIDHYEDKGYQTFLNTVYNISFTWALYVLLLFYLATRSHLASVHPVKKFFAVKSVVFLTYWQYLGLIIFFSFLNKFEQEAINDAVLCFECIFFAILHVKAYGAEEFRTGDSQFIYRDDYMLRLCRTS